MLTCLEYQYLVSQKRGKLLSDEQSDAMHEHEMACESCASYFIHWVTAVEETLMEFQSEAVHDLPPGYEVATLLKLVRRILEGDFYDPPLSEKEKALLELMLGKPWDDNSPPL